MAHRDRLVEAPLLLRLETSSGLRLHRSCVSCCSPRIIGGPPLESSLTRRLEFCFRGQTGKHLLTSRLTGFDPLRSSAGLKSRSAPVSCRTEVCYLFGRKHERCWQRPASIQHDETTRIYHPHRRRGSRVAADGARAAEADADDWVSP